MNRDQFTRAVDALHFNEGWFAEIPRDLLYLAFTRETIPLGLRRLFKQKYGALNHETLEFFGDRVLSIVAATIIYQMNGLAGSPGINAPIYSHLTMNDTLTNIAVQEQLCSALLNGTQCVIRDSSRTADPRGNEMKLEKHNICSDSMEAVFGACYVYALATGKEDIILEMYEWFVSFPSVQALLAKEFSGRQLPSLNISPVNWGISIDISAYDDLWNPCQDDEVAFRFARSS